jgi:hypothetical protein
MFTSGGKYTIIDSSTNISANTSFNLGILWDKIAISGYTTENLSIEINQLPSATGSCFIVNDSLSNIGCYFLDTPFIINKMNIGIFEIFTANTI